MLYYLLQYTSGQVQDQVRSCLAMQEDRGYKEARKLLAERYGQSFKITDHVINDQPIRTEDDPSLQKFLILLTSCRNTLKEISYLNHLENPEGLRKIMEWLPYPLRLKWRELVDTIMQNEARDPNLKDITDFVEARSRVTNHSIFGKIQGEPSRSSSHKYSDRPKRDARSFAVESQSKSPYSPTSNPEKKILKCPSCNKSHWLSQCSDFRKLRLSDQIKFACAKKLCLNCLVSEHFVQDCPKQSFCHIEGCTKKHSTFLHDKDRPQEVTPLQPNQSNGAASTETNATTMQGSNGYVQSGTFQASSVSSTIGLSIVPVKVKAKGQDKKALTYVFLDSRSNTSFCTDALLQKLDAKGVKTTLSLTTMQTTNEAIECSLDNLEVSDLSDHNVIELPMVYSRPSFPVSTNAIGTQEDVNRWPHLKGITVPNIEAEIGLLIGSDAPQVLQPVEVRERPGSY